MLLLLCRPAQDVLQTVASEMATRAVRGAVEAMGVHTPDPDGADAPGGPTLGEDPTIVAVGACYIREQATFAELMTALAAVVPCSAAEAECWLLAVRELKNGRRGRVILPTSSDHTTLRSLRVFDRLQICVEPADSPPEPADRKPPPYLPPAPCLAHV